MGKAERIIRAPHDRENQYFVCTRSTPQDRTLSWEARGVLWYLLSKPDTWEINPEDLKQECGRDKVYRILKELQDHRYIKRQEVRDENGKFIEITYEVYEHPFPEKPEAVKPDTAKPDTEKPYIRELEKEDISYTQPPVLVDEPPAPEEPIRKQYPIFYTVGMKYKDGMHIDPMKFTMDVNAIFYAYLDTLEKVGKGKAAMYDYLWQEHREDCKNLALARVTPQDVTDYILSRYDASVKTNAFWINQDEGMSLRNVVKGISGFIARKSRHTTNVSNMTDVERLREEKNKAKAAELAAARGENIA